MQNGKPRAWEVAETEEWRAKGEKLRGMEEKLGKNKKGKCKLGQSQILVYK